MWCVSGLPACVPPFPRGYAALAAGRTRSERRGAVCSLLLLLSSPLVAMSLSAPNHKTLMVRTHTGAHSGDNERGAICRRKDHAEPRSGCGCISDHSGGSLPSPHATLCSLIVQAKNSVWEFLKGQTRAITAARGGPGSDTRARDAAVLRQCSLPHALDSCVDSQPARSKWPSSDQVRCTAS